MAGLGENCCGGGSGFATGDHKVLVDGADTTPDFLRAKLDEGIGITLTVLNPGANEKVRIAASGTAITGVENVIRYALGVGATQDSVTLIPAGAVVLDAWLDVQTPYTAGTTISIGQPGSLTLLQTATDNDPLAASIYQVAQNTSWGGVALVVRTTVAGGPVAGAGFVVVRFALPDP